MTTENVPGAIWDRINRVDEKSVELERWAELKASREAQSKADAPLSRYEQILAIHKSEWTRDKTPEQAVAFDKRVAAILGPDTKHDSDTVQVTDIRPPASIEEWSLPTSGCVIREVANDRREAAWISGQSTDGPVTARQRSAPQHNAHVVGHQLHQRLK